MALVRWLPQAIDDMQKLDNSIQRRVLKTTKKLEIGPASYGVPLGHHNAKDLSQLYKVEPADGFRVIYDIFENELVIVAVVGKRADERVYKTAAERIAVVRSLVGQELEIISQLTKEMK
jgi:mRNA interferase RelE/StbE